MPRLTFPVLIAAGLFLSACGTSNFDRTISGAVIGAGTGAAVGALAGGGGAAAGALIGGAAGAAGGWFTDPNDVNLGKPLWR